MKNEENKNMGASIAAGALAGTAAAMGVNYIKENVDLSNSEDEDIAQAEIEEVEDVEDIVDDEEITLEPMDEVDYIADAPASIPVVHHVVEHHSTVNDVIMPEQDPEEIQGTEELDPELAVEEVDPTDLDAEDLLHIDSVHEATVAYGSVEGQDVLMIDSDNDGEMDIMLADNNGQLQEIEMPMDHFTTEDAEYLASTDNSCYLEPDDPCELDDYLSNVGDTHDELLASNDLDDELVNDMITDFA